MKQLGEVKYECPKGRKPGLSGHDWKVTILNSKEYHRIYECRKCGEKAEMHKRGFMK